MLNKPMYLCITCDTK